MSAASANGDNTDLSGNEEPVNPDLLPAAARLTKLAKQLAWVGATGAASRIMRVVEMMTTDDIRTIGLEDLERIIDPELVIDERADAIGQLPWKRDSAETGGFFSRLLGLRRSVRLAHWTRNTAALLPLIFTWSALGWAAWEYQLDLHARRDDSGKPFLLLWQQGFTDHFLPFGWVAGFDAVLLLGVVVLTWWVHGVEKSAEEFATSLWDEVSGLEEAMGRGAGRTPVTAQDWARAIDGIIARAFKSTEDLAKQSKKVLSDASDQFASAQAETRDLIRDLLSSSQAIIQDHQALIQSMQADGRALTQALQDGNQEFLAEFQRRTQETISQFSAEVLKTLVSVREQNETFIENTRRTNERVLDDLVQRQLTPLLTQTADLVGQFRTQQESYTTAVTGLAESVTVIQGSAARLADNSQEFTGATRAVAVSLQAMAASQERFANQVEGSAASMTTAAASMGEVKDTLQSVLVGSAEEMTGNITRASASLAQTQTSAAQTQAALAATTAALREAAADFRDATPSQAPPTTSVPEATLVDITQLREVIGSLARAINGLTLVQARRRRWWPRRRSEQRPDGFGGR